MTKAREFYGGEMDEMERMGREEERTMVGFLKMSSHGAGGENNYVGDAVGHRSQYSNIGW